MSTPNLFGLLWLAAEPVPGSRQGGREVSRDNKELSTAFDQQTKIFNAPPSETAQRGR